jgi:predicted Zn-dependent protease
MTPAIHEYHWNVRAAGKTYSLDFRQAFRFGYALAKARKFKAAARVFQALRHSEDAGSLATIMLAYCKAGLGDYGGSSALLCDVFPNDNKTRLDQLHTAFVYASMGMWEDASRELAELTRRCPRVPVICLLLGDLLASQGRGDKALTCWRLAAARDRRDGAVAAVARRAISSQMRPSAKA